MSICQPGAVGGPEYWDSRDPISTMLFNASLSHTLSHAWSNGKFEQAEMQTLSHNNRSTYSQTLKYNSLILSRTYIIKQVNSNATLSPAVLLLSRTTSSHPGAQYLLLRTHSLGTLQLDHFQTCAIFFPQPLGKFQ